MSYYTAGRDHVGHRRVDPLRLEWRGEVAYLIAHCHRRRDQRVFRVDRIRELQKQ
jgi:predicted DNA-binding transcriptional regulator YafY